MGLGGIAGIVTLYTYLRTLKTVLVLVFVQEEGFNVGHIYTTSGLSFYHLLCQSSC